jgi:glycerol uptake facilitator-like aquaporin
MFTILIGVILLIVTLMAVVSGLMKNKGSIKRVAIGALVFIAVLFVGYILSDTANPVLENGKSLYRYGDDVATSSQIKMSGAGIIAFYILAGTAIGAMLLSGAKKIINK